MQCLNGRNAGSGKAVVAYTYTRAVHEECCKIAIVEKSMKLLPCKDWILRLGLQGKQRSIAAEYDPLTRSLLTYSSYLV